jgi:hypothetical protein
MANSSTGGQFRHLRVFTLVSASAQGKKAANRSC